MNGGVEREEQLRGRKHLSQGVGGVGEDCYHPALCLEKSKQACASQNQQGTFSMWRKRVVRTRYTHNQKQNASERAGRLARTNVCLWEAQDGGKGVRERVHTSRACRSTRWSAFFNDSRCTCRLRDSACMQRSRGRRSVESARSAAAVESDLMHVLKFVCMIRMIRMIHTGTY